MFRPISLYIGLRYTRAKRRNHFVSFISLVSMLGIALGVTVLITVLSVMNGFDYEIQNHFFNLANHVSITGMDGQLTNWQSIEKKINQFPQDVKAAAPYVSGQGMLTSQGQVNPIFVTGILPKEQLKVSMLGRKNMIVGSMDALLPGKFGIVIGAGLAGNLGVDVGSNVILLTPRANVSPIGILPTYKRFRVVGIFHVKGNSTFDQGSAFINMQDAQKLYNMGSAVSGIRLKIKRLYDAPKVSSEINKLLNYQYRVTNWTEEYGAFFKAIRMEKTMMFIILMLIIAVAAFNLVSTLVMVVTDKRSEIAILRTLGASPGTIMRTFIVQGCVVGFFGTLLGVIGGVLLALNATEIVNALERTFHTQFISSSVYFINYLPSRLEWSDVIQISIIAIGLSLLATIYPAWTAARTEPAEALRYE